jgi:hypothetical protein
MWKWFLVLALACFGFFPQPASAEHQLDISFSTSLGGLMKYDQWTRLSVTLLNDSEPISGTLELGTDEMEQQHYQSSYRQPFSLQKGEMKEYHFDIPVEILMRGSATIRVLREGKVLQTEKLLPIRPRDERIVGVLDSNQNAFHFLAMGSEQRSGFRSVPFIVQQLDPENLPEESWILKNLDILAIGNVEAEKISERQLAAMKEWIHRGGIVIISAGPQSGEILRRFQDILPIAPGESGNRTNLRELSKYTGETRIPFASIQVYNQNLPLFLSKQTGAGVLLVANYDVTAEPLASWQYNRQLWENVLVKHRVLESIEKRNDRLAVDFGLLRYSNFIPDVSTPSVIWIIVIWLAYVMVIAPLLSFILKRAERREWAWGIIPVSALVLSAGVYLIGRPLVVKEDTSFIVSSVRILDDQLAEVKTGASFLTVSGGDFAVKTAKGFLSLPLDSKRNDLAVDGRVAADGTDGTKEISFENVPYLTVRQAFASGLRDDIGSFSAALTVRGDRLQGRVKNNTSFDLQELRIDLGMQRIPLGSLKKGEEKRIDAKIGKYYLPDQSIQSLQQPFTKEQQISLMKQEIMQGYFPGQIHLVGTCTDDLRILAAQREIKRHAWNVLHQTVQLAPGDNGKIVYPYGLLSTNVESTEGIFDAKSPGLYEIAKGSVTFGLQVAQPNVKAERVQIPLEQSPYRPFRKEIFHAKSGQWKELGREQGVDLQAELHEYVNRDGKILIRFSNPTEQRLSLPEPFFQMEGEEEEA